MHDFRGRRALVTGAAQGIGKAVIRALRASGAFAEGLDVQPGSCEHTFDLSELDGIDSFVSSLTVCPDILVNVAGICPTRPMMEIDARSFEKTLKINVLAPFALTQAVARRLVAEAKTGSIVNIASNSGFMPKLEQLDYGASKAALISLTRSAALSLASRGIRVNAVAPGIIDTPMTKANAERRASIRGVPSEETIRPIVEALPLRRMGSPEEVAEVVLFLASDRASYVTGQTYLVDGGQLMR